MRRITISVLITAVAVASVVGSLAGGSAFADPNNVEVCHVHNGNHPGHTISVSANALEEHLSHGDSIGTCPFGYGYEH